MKTHWAMAMLTMLTISALASQRPTPVELSQALASFQHSGHADHPQVKNIRCHGVVIQRNFLVPTSKLERSTQWRGYAVIVAIDGDHWVVIDEPHRKKAD